MNNREREWMNRKLDRLEELARGSRWNRLWFSPWRYVYGQFFQKLAYPRHRRGRSVVARTFWGENLQIVLPAAMDIFLLGGKSHDSELRLARFMINHLSTGDQVADIGAHYGFFSLLAARLVGPKGRVEAFEAAGGAFEILADNLLKTSVAAAWHLAVSDSERQLAFYEFPTLYTEYNTLSPEQFAGQDWFEENPPVMRTVSAVTMDAFCREHNFYPTFIKIDVEGAEDQVIGGMSALLSANSPVIVMEYLNDTRNNRAHQRAVSQLAAWRFRPHFISSTGELEQCKDISAYLHARGIDSDNLVFISDQG